MSTLGIEPGPKIGEILQKLFDEVVEKNLPNERGELLKRLQELG
jgi:tRNA nucleotidyltransferase/poly(A) polymerase